MFCTKEDPPTHTPREGWWPNIYDKFVFLNGYLSQYLGQRERERERKEERREREEVRKKEKKEKWLFQRNRLIISVVATWMNSIRAN